MSLKFFLFHFILKYKLWISTSSFVFILFFVQLMKKHDHSEKIDVVYTWVNGSDTRFLNNLDFLLKTNKSNNIDSSPPRFDDKAELKFSLRSLEKFAPWINHVYIVTNGQIPFSLNVDYDNKSLEKYAPWINHVYIVTNGQIPFWLNLDYDKVTLISHEEIFDDPNDLPTFSSPAIESHLHNIPGISKRFIYFNDDIFLGAPVYLDDFYTSSRGHLIYLSWPISECAPDCPWLYVNDGQCDNQCYTTLCQMDGTDCDNEEKNAEGQLVKIRTYDVYETDLEVKESSQKTINTTNFFKSIIPNDNISTLISEHNRKIMQKNKLKRRSIVKLRKQKLGYLINNLVDTVLVTNVNTFANSLQYSNRVFNSKYGFRPRYVVAHMPFFIDVDIMKRLKQKLGDEFVTTSRNKIRRNNDLQFAFSYFYFIIHERLRRDIDDVFDIFDTDLSGTWSDREIRTILTKLYDLPLTYEVVDHFELVLTNCSINKQITEVTTPEFERYIDSKLPTISKELIRECPVLRDVLLQKFGTYSKYDYEIIKNSEEHSVTFKMLTSNVSELVGHLDEIRRKTTKFVCLNDNLDITKNEENELVKAVLYDFYLSLFPIPSQFELPQEFRNRFSYLDELGEWKSYHLKLKLILLVIFLLFLYISTFFFNKRVICGHVNKICL